MGQTIEQRGGHLGIAEHARPFTEGEVCGEDNGGAFVEAADEMEQELAAGLGEGQIAEFVEDDEVQSHQMIGEPALGRDIAVGDVVRHCLVCGRFWPYISTAFPY